MPTAAPIHHHQASVRPTLARATEPGRPSVTPVGWPTGAADRARPDPGTLTPRGVVQLQRAIGNQAVLRLLGARAAAAGPAPPTARRAGGRVQRNPPAVLPAQSDYDPTPSGQDREPPGGAMKDRAGTVVATLIPTNHHLIGQQPQNAGNPPGWWWAGQLMASAGQSWVRFHILNHNLGGPGNDSANLVPTLTKHNHNPNWRTFEEGAKDFFLGQSNSGLAKPPALVNHRAPVHFEVQVAYHPPMPPAQNQPGRAHIHNFPQQITGSFWYYHNGGWQGPFNVNLPIPRPALSAANAEHILTDLTAYALQNTFQIDSWLATRLVERQGPIDQVRPPTVQDLYNFLYDWVGAFPGGVADGRQALNVTWGPLQTALNKTQGNSLRIYDGWQPNGSVATLSVAIDVGGLYLANDAKLGDWANQLGLPNPVFLKRLQAGLNRREVIVPTMSDVYRWITAGLDSATVIATIDPIWPAFAAKFAPPGVYLKGIAPATVTTRTEERQRQVQQTGDITGALNGLAQERADREGQLEIAARAFFHDRSETALAQVRDQMRGGDLGTEHGRLAATLNTARQRFAEIAADSQRRAGVVAQLRADAAGWLNTLAPMPDAQAELQRALDASIAEIGRRVQPLAYDYEANQLRTQLRGALDDDFQVIQARAARASLRNRVYHYAQNQAHDLPPMADKWFQRELRGFLAKLSDSRIARLDQVDAYYASNTTIIDRLVGKAQRGGYGAPY